MSTDTRRGHPDTSRTPPRTDDGSAVARTIRPLLAATVGAPPPVRFAFWDGSATGPDDVGTVHVDSPLAIRRIVWAPGHLGVARAYVAGDLHVSGDLFGVLTALRDATPAGVRFGWRAIVSALRVAHRLGALGRPPQAPREEARPVGWQHSIRRDASVIGHHYDVGNDFYRLVLGPAMTYSCARFTGPDVDLRQAQDAKHELVCRKLGLHERGGMRLLDVGCGWGSLAIHAARHHGAQVVGITISRAQAELARRRAADAGVADRVEIRLQDYREVCGERFDAISSIGMSEHVGSRRIDQYFAILYALLEPRGRLLNHAITSTDGSRLSRRSFAGRYVFPDGELLDVGDLQLAMERAGLEIRDVESLREHYATTLRHWVANLDANWDEAVALVGRGRARVWRLYMAGSAIGFADNGLSVHQVLAVRPDDGGASGMPTTRRGWE
ncbi:MAG TPA: cyclopropane-fatty-acyl-phospholipid synthase family protein [Euzebyales bacterium]